MKKPLIALSIVCASALALADSAQPYDNWFKGISSATSINALGESNGEWLGLTAENASVKDGALVLNLDADDEGNAEEATFKITDSSEIGATQVLIVKGVFAPIAKDDLLPGATMTTKGAQVGFAVVTEDSGNSFYAWVGATGGDDASANWQKLFTAETDAANAAALAADADGEKTLTITLSYNPTQITATFSVTGSVTTTAESTSTVTVTNEALELTGGAKTVAETKKAIASVSCTGSGTLSALNGSGNCVVAEGVKADGTAANGWKFDTASDAIAAAQATGGSGEIILRRAVAEDVSFAGWLRVHYDQSVSAVKTSIDTYFKPASGSPQTYKVTDASSLEGFAYMEWQLNNETLLEVKINDKVIGGGVWGTDSVASKELQKFLLNNCPDIYRSSSATSETIQNALLNDGGNGYKLWQSFVMGVGANEKVTLKPVETDMEPNDIAITLASTIPDSPFANSIKYTVLKDASVVVGATELKRYTPVVKIPLATGKYSVSFTIE